MVVAAVHATCSQHTGTRASPATLLPSTKSGFQTVTCQPHFTGDLASPHDERTCENSNSSWPSWPRAWLMSPCVSAAGGRRARQTVVPRARSTAQQEEQGSREEGKKGCLLSLVPSTHSNPPPLPHPCCASLCRPLG